MGAFLGSRGLALGLCAVAAGALAACGGGGNTCGAGTVMMGTMCVPVAGDGGGTTCGAGTVLMNGVCVATGGDGGSTTCGAGTVLMNGMCVATGGDGGGASCGPGTTQGDGGVCLPTPAGPSLTGVTVTHADVEYDETQSLFVGHPVPVRLGITTTAATAPRSGVPTQVVVSLLEHFTGTPSATQAMALRQCVLGSFVAELDGSGTEQQFSRNFIIPPECLPTGATTVTYNLVVQLDNDGLVFPDSVTTTFAFTDSMRTTGPTAMCRSSFDMSAMADGCMHQLRVAASPGTDVRPTVEPQGSVALLWMPDPANPTAPRREMLTVLVDERAFGRDPYTVIGAAAATLPGNITVSTRIAPAVGPRAGEFIPLNVQNATSGMPPVANRTVGSLAPASDNRTEYNLFPTDTLLTNIQAGGAWANVDQFTIETCLAPSFTEQGELGDRIREGEENTSPRTAASDNCSRFTVLGVRALPPATNASRLDLNREWSRRWGNDKLALNGSLTTQNAAFVGGASSDTNANVTITSQYLPDISIARARAYAGFDLFNLDSSGIEFWVDVLGVRLYNYERRVPTSRELYNRDWNIMRRQCRSKTVMISIIPISVEGCAQGTVGLAVDVGLYRDADVMGGRRFPSADTEGQLAATARPYATAGASASVSVDALIARAGVEGTLTVIDISAPLMGSANVGLTRMNASTGRPSAQANINLNWNLNIQGLNGSVSLFADTRGVRWCRKWGIPYPCGVTWDRRGELNLFSFGADRETFELFNRTFANTSLAP